MSLVVAENVSQFTFASEQLLQDLTRALQEALESFYSGPIGSYGLEGKRLAIEPRRVLVEFCRGIIQNGEFSSGAFLVSQDFSRFLTRTGCVFSSRYHKYSLEKLVILLGISSLELKDFTQLSKDMAAVDEAVGRGLLRVIKPSSSSPVGFFVYLRPTP